MYNKLNKIFKRCTQTEGERNEEDLQQKNYNEKDKMPIFVKKNI